MTGGYDSIKRSIAAIMGMQNVLENEPMRNHTSFKAGGAARLLVKPGSPEELSCAIRVLNKENIPFYVMGNGTNLLVRDNGFNGVIFKLCGDFSKVYVNDLEIKAEAGALLSAVSKIAYENSLSGLEFAEGIPGTVGGAVAMNAGAYGGEMKDVVISATVMDNAGSSFVLSGGELELGYRSSVLGRQGLICLSTEMCLKNGIKSEIKAKMDENKKFRTEKQPLNKPSAGSTFKRPEGYFAGKLISDSGLKGFRIGGVAVSEKHAGFIINDGDASAADIIGLIGYVQKTVFEKFGVKLEPEVKIIGD